jgi:uncharacterized protein YqgC (DUF456 family)
MELTNSIHFLIGFIALLVMVVGLVGTVLPGLPSIELIWLATLGYGFFSGWGAWGPWLFALLTVILIIGEFVMWWLGNTTARQTGASWQAIGASIVLGIIGMFVIPIVGALIGAMLGVFLVEFYRRRNWREALKATTGVLWGTGLSFGAQVVIAIVMMGIWGLWFYTRAMEIGL